MTYTNPTPTLANDDLITKAYMDTIYDNLMWLQRRPYHQYGLGGTGQTTTSASLVDISGTSIAVNAPTATNAIIVVQAHFNYSVANGAFILGVKKNTVTDFSIGFNTLTTGGTISYYHFLYVTALAAGVNNFNLMWAVSSGGTLTMSNGYGFNYVLWEVGA